MDLNIGQVISNTFGMVKQRFGGLLGIWFIYFALQFALMFLFGALGLSSVAAVGAVDNPFAMGAGFVLMLVLVYVGIFLLGIASNISLTHHASPLLSPDVGSSFMAGLKSVLTALGLLLILIVGYFVVAIPLGIVFAILSFAGEAGAFIGVLIALGVLLFLACRLVLIVPIIAVEGQRNPITAITRSWALTNGNALKIFLTLLAFSIIIFVLFFLISAMLGGGIMATALGLDAGAGAGDVAAFSGIVVLAFLVFFLIMIVAAMIGASFMSALHAGLAPTASVGATFE